MAEITPMIPASWGGFDLQAASDMPLGQFAQQVRKEKDPLYGWPDIPDCVADELTKLQARCPVAIRREPELRSRYRSSYEVWIDAERNGALAPWIECRPEERLGESFPLSSRYCEEILEDFAARCGEEAAGLTFTETNWANWAEAEEDAYS
ncbi:hypothetical protein ACFPL7_22060 [Dongia soli]|uniref:Uncharacterized protein n=1 Tax=Dongia soli TaxID=600628 RepID=A0ABU5E9J7_9PROT|nr:hypothetical protein [Dongia soli]MDY0882275.1 hypothetical protein [Dongia soli]